MILQDIICHECGEVVCDFPMELDGLLPDCPCCGSTMEVVLLGGSRSRWRHADYPEASSPFWDDHARPIGDLEVVFDADLPTERPVLGADGKPAGMTEDKRLESYEKRQWQRRQTHGRNRIYRS